MTRMYPIFTNGKKFVHSSDSYHDGDWRFAYFSTFNLGEWKKKEAHTLTAKHAKHVYQSWSKLTIGEREIPHPLGVKWKILNWKSDLRKLMTG